MPCISCIPLNSGIQLCKSASPLQLNFPLLGFQLADNKGEILYGGIAQLGERLNGIQEVSGSIPLISTRSLLKTPPCTLKTEHCDYDAIMRRQQ